MASSRSPRGQALTPRPVRHLEHVMGTVVTFDVYEQVGADHRDLYVHLARARALLQRFDALFSLCKPHSSMSRIRRGELDVVDAPPEIGTVLGLCSQAFAATNGWFDADALPGGIDPTGLVKGWAAQRALDVLTAAGFADAMINAGGDIATAGRPDGADCWRIGIQHPLRRGQLAAVVAVDGAIATSGTYERGAHLFDPQAKRQLARFASASVTGPDLALADAAATGLAVAGDDGFDFVEALDGYEAFAVRSDGTKRMTAGFPLAPADVAS
jgi:thiamine biosynthesis lipoprotein